MFHRLEFCQNTSPMSSTTPKMTSRSTHSCSVNDDCRGGQQNLDKRLMKLRHKLNQGAFVFLQHEAIGPEMRLPVGHLKYIEALGVDRLYERCNLVSRKMMPMS